MLQQQDAEGRSSVNGVQLCAIGEDPENAGGGRERHHCPDGQGYPELEAGEEGDPAGRAEGQADLQCSAHYGDVAEPEESLDGELQPEGEEEQGDAQLRENGDTGVGMDDVEDGRPHEGSREEVTEDRRLPERFEEHAQQQCGGEQEDQLEEEGPYLPGPSGGRSEKGERLQGEEEPGHRRDDTGSGSLVNWRSPTDRASNRPADCRRTPPVPEAAKLGIPVE